MDEKDSFALTLMVLVAIFVATFPISLFVLVALFILAVTGILSVIWCGESRVDNILWTGFAVFIVCILLLFL